MSAMSELDARVQELQALGFTAALDDTNSYLRIRCTQCDALVINSVPCHETGCVNQTRECAGCDNPIPRLQFSRFCEDCR